MIPDNSLIFVWVSIVQIKVKVGLCVYGAALSLPPLPRNPPPPHSRHSVESSHCGPCYTVVMPAGRLQFYGPHLVVLRAVDLQA